MRHAEGNGEAVGCSSDSPARRSCWQSSLRRRVRLFPKLALCCSREILHQNLCRPKPKVFALDPDMPAMDPLTEL
eukprot:scaffold870_cov268-Pinguiococcus_pyrenoidosus.AAC.66